MALAHTATDAPVCEHSLLAAQHTVTSMVARGEQARGPSVVNMSLLDAEALLQGSSMMSTTAEVKEVDCGWIGADEYISDEGVLMCRVSGRWGGRNDADAGSCLNGWEQVDPPWSTTISASAIATGTAAPQVTTSGLQSR